MRGFLTVEILIAMVLMIMTLGAVSYTVLTLPGTINSIERQATQIQEAHALIRDARFGSASPETVSVPLEDERLFWIQASTSWKDTYQHEHHFSLQTLATLATTSPAACDPFVSGDWSHPEALGSFSVDGNISALTTIQNVLVVTLASTTRVTSPTLLFFSLSDILHPKLEDSFDNASSSRIGFSTISSNGEILFVGNGFGSASPLTCADSRSCAQIHVFKYLDGAPSRISEFSLATTSLPYAKDSSGANVGASSLIAYDHYIYLGLYKTSGGDEFNIIDTSDPTRLRWVGGYPIGRTVNNIVVREGFAYVSTDDPARELIVFDIRNPFRPIIAGVWNAPGTATFGYGAASTVYPGTVRFGRTYSATEAEFELLDTSNLGKIMERQHVDVGVARDPESVRAIITQAHLTFLLLTHRLEIFETGGLKPPVRLGVFNFSSDSSGVALTCRNNLMFIGRNTARGGVIDILRGA